MKEILLQTAPVIADKNGGKLRKMVEILWGRQIVEINFLASVIAVKSVEEVEGGDSRCS